MSIEVEVILEEIKCIYTAGDDDFGYNALEVRGSLGVSVGPEQFNVREAFTLWRKPDDQGEVIPSHDSLQLHRRRTLTVHPDEFVWIGGHLMEDDDLSADDNLGDHRPFFSYLILNHNTNGIREPIRFEGQGQRVEVVYFLKKLRNV